MVSVGHVHSWSPGQSCVDTVLCIIQLAQMTVSTRAVFALRTQLAGPPFHQSRALQHTGKPSEKVPEPGTKLYPVDSWSPLGITQF